MLIQFFLKLFLRNDTFLNPLKKSENVTFKIITLEKSELRSGTAKGKVKITSRSIVRLAYIVLNHNHYYHLKKTKDHLIKISGYIERMVRVIKVILVISTCTSGIYLQLILIAL